MWCEKNPRLGEAKAHRAQAERGIGRNAGQSVQTLLLLVGPQVERADRHRLSTSARCAAAIDLELLVFRRQPLAIQEQEFGPEESDAGRAVVERLLQIAG